MCPPGTGEAQHYPAGEGVELMIAEELRKRREAVGALTDGLAQIEDGLAHTTVETHMALLQAQAAIGNGIWALADELDACLRLLAADQHPRRSE